MNRSSYVVRYRALDGAWKESVYRYPTQEAAMQAIQAGVYGSSGNHRIETDPRAPFVQPEEPPDVDKPSAIAQYRKNVRDWVNAARSW